MNTDYYAFGQQIPGRTWTGGDNYRFGFNGKEHDNEVQGAGNSYDFGARIYDPRLGRWLACDPKFGKYPGTSPYHFGYNNPIITIDPNGEENIVVIGGVDVSGRDRYKFINTGLKQAGEYAEGQPKEKTTIVLFTAGMTSEEVHKTYKEALSIGENVNIVQVASSAQLTNYLNSKSIKESGLSESRTDDKVTDITFFGHGYAPGNSNEESGTYEPGHAVYSAGSYHHDDLTWGKSDIENLNPEAFNNVNADFESCNSVTPNSNGESLAQEFSAKTKGKAQGWKGKSDYGSIYATFTNIFGFHIGASNSYPKAGKTNDRKEVSTKVKYNNGKATK